jgi:hypothetical protein
MTSNINFEKTLKQQRDISLEQSKELKFKVSPIEKDGNNKVFAIYDITEDAIMKLKILSQNFNYNTFITIRQVYIFTDKSDYVINFTMGAYLNEAINQTKTNKSITTPFAKLYGTNKLTINETVDELNAINNSSSLNIVKKYKLVIGISFIFGKLKSNLKGGNSDTVKHPVGFCNTKLFVTETAGFGNYNGAEYVSQVYCNEVIHSNATGFQKTATWGNPYTTGWRWKANTNNHSSTCYKECGASWVNGTRGHACGGGGKYHICKRDR